MRWLTPAGSCHAHLVVGLLLRVPPSGLKLCCSLWGFGALHAPELAMHLAATRVRILFAVETRVQRPTQLATRLPRVVLHGQAHQRGEPVVSRAPRTRTAVVAAALATAATRPAPASVHRLPRRGRLSRSWCFISSPRLFRRAVPHPHSEPTPLSLRPGLRKGRDSRFRFTRDSPRLGCWSLRLRQCRRHEGGR